MIKLTLRFSSPNEEHQVVDIEPISVRQVPDQRIQDVDIVICIHNALEDVKRCIASVEERTTEPYRMILVDDGSGEETAQFLASYAQANVITLLRSDQATGYTLAANRGLRDQTLSLCFAKQ
jgi:cellulose synthase/poly-beta-1,6-N-acetylglucosamine synthase-like glycosyltransferase